MLLLGKDGNGMTAWHITVKKGQIELLHKLWEWAKEVLTQEELNNMFLAAVRDERTAWHIAIEKG
jgi:ankyrin repeat protein